MKNIFFDILRENLNPPTARPFQVAIVYHFILFLLESSFDALLKKEDFSKAKFH